MVFLPPALEEESLPGDLFSVLFKCEGHDTPWRALLAHAVALQRPLLAILAACYEVSLDGHVLSFFIFSTTSILIQNSLSLSLSLSQNNMNAHMQYKLAVCVCFCGMMLKWARYLFCCSRMYNVLASWCCLVSNTTK